MRWFVASPTSVRYGENGSWEAYRGGYIGLDNSIESLNPLRSIVLRYKCFSSLSRLQTWWRKHRLPRGVMPPILLTKWKINTNLRKIHVCGPASFTARGSRKRSTKSSAGTLIYYTWKCSLSNKVDPTEADLYFNIITNGNYKWGIYLNLFSSELSE